MTTTPNGITRRQSFRVLAGLLAVLGIGNRAAARTTTARPAAPPRVTLTPAQLACIRNTSAPRHPFANSTLTPAQAALIRHLRSLGR